MNILKNIKFNKYIVLLFLIIIIVFTYLNIKAIQVESWDDWGFGSAQIMLGVRHWTRDGMVNHKFFLLPSGYHPEIKFLDEPEFRFLADGIDTGELLGRRLYYAHYPSGYLMPYGFLAKLGFENRFWFRSLSLLLSFGAIFFIYGFIYLIANKKHGPALIAVSYYITSTTFLRYADTLSNQPIDDLFKWSILFFSIFLINYNLETKIKKKINILIWILYLLLASSSYDSTFFIFIWLCALMYFNNFDKNRRWYKQIFIIKNLKVYLLWASAPILAFIIQMAQNVWYLGWKDMMLDFLGAFLARSSEVSGSVNFLSVLLKNLIVALASFGYFTDLRTRFVLPLFLVLFYLALKYKIFKKKLWYYIVVLTVGGLMIGLVLPGVGIFGYQGRQIAPALLIVISILTYELMKDLKLKKLDFHNFTIISLLAIVWFFHFNATCAYVMNWPNNAVSKDKIEYWDSLKRQTDQNTIILSLKNKENLEYTKFIPQFYTDRLMLWFDNERDLLEYRDKIKLFLKDKVKFLIITN